MAIPACNEADRIGPCLAALSNQSQRPDAVVLMLNNCTDQTAAIARSMAPRLGFRLDLAIRQLPPRQANAGHARRIAMEIAASQADADDILLTTDADAIVPPDWIARNREALRYTADLVCGQAVIDPGEAALIPAHLHADDALECRLISLIDHLAWTLDPEPHDPPPRHTEASGASIAVRADAFRQAGGIPDIPAGEDRAFVRTLWMRDARIRHDPAIQVTVSGRIVGRASGGMADAIRRRMVQQDEFTDAQVEPAVDAFRRYSLRYRTRRLWGGHPDTRLASDLALSRAQMKHCLNHHFFGATWAALEATSIILQRRGVRFTDLPAEIAVAEALSHQLSIPETLAAD